MRDGFHSLWHHLIVSRDNQNHDVGHLRTTRTHCRKSLVARRVKEGDALAGGQRHMICTDMLSDTARFARHDVRFANVVEQGSLAVIDVTHDGHDRRPRLKLFLRVLGNRGV